MTLDVQRREHLEMWMLLGDPALGLPVCRPTIDLTTNDTASAGKTIVCGHWSTLELRLAPNLLMIDSGCLWGGTLTAVRLDDARVFQAPSRSALVPKPFE